MDRALEEVAARYRARGAENRTGPATVYHLYDLYLSRPDAEPVSPRETAGPGFDIAGVIGEVGGPVMGFAAERYAANRRTLQRIEACIRVLREIGKGL